MGREQKKQEVLASGLIADCNARKMLKAVTWSYAHRSCRARNRNAKFYRSGSNKQLIECFTFGKWTPGKKPKNQIGRPSKSDSNSLIFHRRKQLYLDTRSSSRLLFSMQCWNHLPRRPLGTSLSKIKWSNTQCCNKGMFRTGPDPLNVIIAVREQFIIFGPLIPFNQTRGDHSRFFFGLGTSIQREDVGRICACPGHKFQRELW